MFSTSVFPPAAPLTVLPTAGPSPKKKHKSTSDDAGPSPKKIEKTTSDDRHIVVTLIDSRDGSRGIKDEPFFRIMAFDITKVKNEPFDLKFPAMLDQRLSFEPTMHYSRVLPGSEVKSDELDFVFVGCDLDGRGMELDYDDSNGNEMDFKDVKADVKKMMDVIVNKGHAHARHMQMEEDNNLLGDTKWVTIHVTDL